MNFLLKQRAKMITAVEMSKTMNTIDSAELVPIIIEELVPAIIEELMPVVVEFAITSVD